MFKDKEICENYIHTVNKLWPEWISIKDKTSMQFIADICKSMNIKGYLSIDDLYKLSEKEINDFLNIDTSDYGYFDFDFKPYFIGVQKVLKKQ